MRDFMDRQGLAISFPDLLRRGQISRRATLSPQILLIYQTKSARDLLTKRLVSIIGCRSPANKVLSLSNH
jgi:hypothetical protein